MSSEEGPLIEVENVTKVFCRDLKRSLWYGVKDTLSEFRLRSFENSDGEEGLQRELRPGEFLANEGISFTVNRGECLGLIGHNGAGKTTLLKMLNGLIKPDSGEIRMHGRVGSLIALGAGFNPILTGRENIYVNGAILGLSKKEITERIDRIIEFSEIEDAIDSPVRTYSSGMQVKLGFAVAINLDPDILLIDEVLAVGDAGFRSKCMNVLNEKLKSVAVIFVSHSMPQILGVCTHAALLNSGKIVRMGSQLAEISADYFSEFGGVSSQTNEVGDAKITAVEVNGTALKANEEVSVAWGKSLTVQLSISASVDIENVIVNLIVRNRENIGVFASVSDQLSLSSQGTLVTITVPEICLTQGPYSCAIGINEMSPDGKPKLHASYAGMAKFKVVQEDIYSVQANAIFHIPGIWSSETATPESANLDSA
jgi:lipopolysaccharide transport system ATP-binding protein